MKLTEGFNLLATAPDGIKRLRELILSLAVQGKLVPQDPNDEPASELLKKIRAEKQRLVAEGKIKKDKPLPAIGDDEKQFELPEGWVWARLDEVGSTFIGLTYSPNDVSDSSTGIPVLRSSNIQKGKIDLGDLVRVRIDVKPQLMVADGDLLICARNGSKALVGKAAIIRNLNESMTFGAFMAIYKSRLNPFVDVFIQSPVFRGMLEGVSTTTINQITQNNLKNTVIAIPPLAEQSRIVAKVEEMMALCDALETRGQLEAEQHARLTATLFDALAASESAHQLQENWGRLAASFDLVLDRPEAVDALEQTLLQLAVRGLLVPQDPADEPASELLKQIRAEKDRLIAEGKIKKDKPLPAISEDEKPFGLPEGWEWVRLGVLIELVSGQHLGPSEYKEGLESGIPYLTGPAEFGEFSPFPTRSTKERRAVAIAGDILITVKGSGVGKLNITAHPEIAISRQLMAIRPIGIVSGYLMLVLQTMGAQFQEKSVGIAIPGIGRDDVRFALIGLPPLAEQSRIVTRVEALRALCGQLRQRLAASRQTQAHLAETLVTQI